MRIENVANREEDPQEDEDDMEIDIEEDKNEPELTYPYEEVDPLNPPPPASESEPDDEIEVENPIKLRIELIPVGCVARWRMPLWSRKKERQRDTGFNVSSFDLGVIEVRSSVEQGTTAMEKLVGKLENVEEKAECKKLKKELEEARLSNIFLHMRQKTRLSEILYWPRVRLMSSIKRRSIGGFDFKRKIETEL
ncbi:hypothetical protein Tco_0527113 [Tanacetum coccineum]